MGQCGCSDTTPDFQIPGPSGITYGIQIYPSCHYCSTPAGIDVYRFDDDEAAEWLNDVPEAAFMSYGHESATNAQLSIPILDPIALISELSADSEQTVDETDMRYALRGAVFKTLEQWRRRAS